MNTTNSLVLILISFGLFFLFGKPAFSDINILREEKAKYNAAIDQINLLESKKNELLAKLNAIPASDREKMETFLPTKEGLVRLIADIDGIASKHGIGIQSADFGETKTDLSRSVSEIPAVKAYNTKTLNITFSADYNNLAKFLVDLEKSLRILDIRTIDFSVGNLSSERYQYKISAEVYWLKDLQYEQ